MVNLSLYLLAGFWRETKIGTRGKGERKGAKEERQRRREEEGREANREEKRILEDVGSGNPSRRPGFKLVIVTLQPLG